MNYEKKSKKVKFIAALLTAVLICGTFLAGAYPVYAADSNTQTQESDPIRIRDAELRNGSIALKKTKQPALLPQKAVQTITYESVELRHYEEGSPYLHDVQTNGTKKDILEIERGMLAYDKDGNPLKLKWYPFDEEDEPAYFYLFADDMELKAGETYDIRGGWSLDLMEKESGDQAEQVAYALYCNRKISFADGTVWENPEFEQWLSTYEGKKIPVEELQQYYPYVQTVALSDTPPNT